jgi:hypothetical protein
LECSDFTAIAVLDWFLHHSITLNIRGNSKRLREKFKAGQLKPRSGPDTDR